MTGLLDKLSALPQLQELLAALHIMSDGLYGIMDANFDRLMRDHGYDAPDESGEDKDVF